ncbi:sensor histidine kinase [Stackebrandtia nassauensis]|uniref:histidine kinase n=1 Tax=Stackebrandtia nassauensis (strain DSM 44728 / CIP 108903 / NRRL B-16338 / NBRC 102104 / LLR-40K-21) TaxID=446470 RepID=D3PUL2_STANL|nr:histidine kinase [Stackebrandtia nassauensis]ADD43025.1 histidine kinase [Stackebrandtia nassauensis DSM 44728]
MIDLRRARDTWRGWDVTIRDLPLALLLFGGSFLPALRDHVTQVGDLPPRPFDAYAAVLLVVLCAPVAVRRRWPAVSLALVSLGFLIGELFSYHFVAGAALPIAILSAGAHLAHHRRVTIAILSTVYVALAITLDRFGSTEGFAGFGLFYLGLAISWGVGSWLRSTRATEAERRRLVAEATRTTERERIARELHDVVTHHVTAMVVQAEAARYLTATPDRLDETLTAVTDTGRRAITDLRHLLDLLNPDHGTETPTPSIGDLHSLVEHTRRAGQPVEFTETGTPNSHNGSAEFVAHRVVQEALTNALKHAHGQRTTVEVHYRSQEIAVEVTTDGSGSQAASPGGSGRGLTGLRERVSALGGDFSAVHHRPDGYLIRARIPTGTAS